MTLPRIQSLTCCARILCSTSSQERGAHCISTWSFNSHVHSTVPSSICLYASVKSEHVASWRCSSWKPHISEKKKNPDSVQVCAICFYSPDPICVFKSNCSKIFKILHCLPLFIAREQYLPFSWNIFTTDVTLVFDNKQRGGDLG